MLLSIAFVLFYIVVPLGILLFALANISRPRVSSRMPTASLRTPVTLRPSTILGQLVARLLRIGGRDRSDDPVTAFIAEASDPSDFLAAYSLTSIRLAHSSFDTAVMSVALSRADEPELAALVRRSARAFLQNDKAALYIALSRMISTTLRKRLRHTGPVPSWRRSYTDSQLLDEMNRLSHLIATTSAWSDFFTRLARWQQPLSWANASPRLLLALRHMSQRLTTPSLSSASSLRGERETLEAERNTISRLAQDVDAALRSRDYARLMDILSEDFRRTSTQAPRDPSGTTPPTRSPAPA